MARARKGVALIRSASIRCQCFLMACLFGLLAISTASAQYTPPANFCKSSGAGGCFPSKAEAEVKLREDFAFGARIEMYSASPNFSGEMWYHYDVVRRHEPEKSYTTGYYMTNTTPPCKLANDPQRPAACESEAEAAKNRAEQIRTNSYPSCTLVSYSLRGDYTEPYSAIRNVGNGSGNIYYGAKFLDVVIQCGNEQVTPGDIIHKATSFDCPAGLTPATSSSSPAVLPALCTASANEYITGPAPTQFGNCSTEHPCHPSTGDKSRNETDFVFAGRPFVRYYHSLDQYRGATSLGAAWAHSFTERIDDSGPYRFSPQGEYEGFVSIGTNRYRAQNSEARILDVLASGDVKFRLTDADGEIREFGTNGRLMRIHDPNAPDSDVELEYDSAGRLLRVVDVFGRTLTFVYSPTGFLTSITLPDGSKVSYTYDTAGNLTVVDYGNSQRKIYHYHEPSLVNQNFINHLTGITDETGQRYASFGYDAHGRVTSSQLHANGGYVNKTTLRYDTADKVTVTSETGDTQTFNMQSGGYRRITKLTDSSGDNNQTYDSSDRLSTQTDPRGIITKYGYTDTATTSYLSSLTEAAGTEQERKTTFTRNSDNRLTESKVYGLQNGVQTLKRIESWVYDANGRNTVSCVADPAVSYVCGSQVNAPTGVRQTRMTYCQQADVNAGNCPLLGQIIKIDGPRIDVSDITTYTYYPSDDPTCGTTPTTCPHRKGDLWKVTNALNHVVETLKYDGAGRALSVKNANGVITDFEYSSRGWLTAQKRRGANNAVETDDQIVRIAYWGNGLVQKITDPTGAAIRFSYDAAQRLTYLTDADDNKVHYELDSAGNQTKEQTLKGGTAEVRLLTRTFDILGQLITQSDSDAVANTTRFTYDKNGNLETMTEALAQRTRQEYDPLDRLKRRLEDETGLKIETKYEYDALDNLTKVTDPRQKSTTYTYNAFGEVTQEVSPDRKTTTYTYDSAGNLISKVDARNVTWNYTYDALNRLRRIHTPTGNREQLWSYDACSGTFGIGRLCSTGIIGTNILFAYDRFGNMTVRKDIIKGKEGTGAESVYTTNYTYDVAGRLTIIQYPNGMKVTYGYVRDKPTSMKVTIGTADTTIISGATYEPFGPVNGWTYGNGLKRLIGFNKDGQPNAISTNGTNPLQSLTYAFDENNRIHKITNYPYSTNTQEYDYDSVSHLRKFILPVDGTWTYSYDSAGNRTKLEVAKNGQITRTDTYAIDDVNNRLNTIGGGQTAAFGYDEAGNTTSAYGLTLTYNGFNRLQTVSRNGVQVAAYQYNVFNERTFKTAPQGDFRYVYMPDSQLLSEHQDNGDIWTNYLWFGGELVGMVRSNQIYYVHNDHLGRPELVTDAAKAVKWRGNNYPFNRTVGLDAIGGLNVGFPGQYYDAESGFFYNINRYYDQNTDKYLQVDLIGLLGGINPYVYVDANPTASIDSLGLFCDGPSTCAIGRDIEAMNHGEMSQKEFMDRSAARAGGAAVGLTTLLLGRTGYGGLLIAALKYCPRNVVEEATQQIMRREPKDPTRRPTKFRKKTLQDAWDNAAAGSKPNTRSCPDCKKDVEVAPGTGRRDWDGDHQPKWKDRDLTNMTRKDVLNEYNRGVRVRCPTCNRRDN